MDAGSVALMLVYENTWAIPFIKAALDQGGQVIATDYGWIFDDIVNNASADYEVAVYLPEGFDINSAEYEILVKGDLP